MKDNWLHSGCYATVNTPKPNISEVIKLQNMKITLYLWCVKNKERKKERKKLQNICMGQCFTIIIMIMWYLTNTSWICPKVERERNARKFYLTGSQIRTFVRSTDRCLLRNEMTLGPFKYPQCVTVGHGESKEKDYRILLKQSNRTADYSDLQKLISYKTLKYISCR